MGISSMQIGKLIGISGSLMTTTNIEVLKCIQSNFIGSFSVEAGHKGFYCSALFIFQKRGDNSFMESIAANQHVKAGFCWGIIWHTLSNTHLARHRMGQQCLQTSSLKRLTFPVYLGQSHLGYH